MLYAVYDATAIMYYCMIIIYFVFELRMFKTLWVNKVFNHINQIAHMSHIIEKPMEDNLPISQIIRHSFL